MVKPTINSKKHVFQTTIATAAMGAKSAIVVADSIAVPVSGNDVLEGCLIKSVYFEYWLTGDDAAQSSFVVSIEKYNSTQTAMTYAQSIGLDVYANKKNILWTSMGLAPPNTQNPLNVIRQWVNIPKGKQRFGLGDRFAFNFSGISDGINICGFAIFKEYR